jgi:methionyl-tRNA formyltransferase
LEAIHTVTPRPPVTRILLCTNGGLFGGLVLRRLLASPGVAVVGVVESTRVLRSRQSWLNGVLALRRQSGLRYTAYLGCATILAEAIGGWSGLPPVARAARDRGIPVLVTADLNRSDGVDFVRQLRPDLLLSAFFNQRIGATVGAVATLGSVNIHPSLLPDFKGVDPVFHARLAGAPRLGVSLHRITSEFDTGPLLAQREVPVEAEASVLAATARLFAAGADLLLDCLPALLRGDPGRAQPPGGGYDSWPTRAQVRRFLSAGHRLVRLGDLRRSCRDDGSSGAVDRPR